MFLGNISMICLASLLISFLLMSCVKADINIADDSGKCILTVDKQIIELQLKSPCSLVKVDNNGRYFHQYHNVKVYIVAGVPAPLDKLTRWAVTPADKCSLQSQAVFLNHDKVTISTIRDKGLTCPDIGLDEKVYRNFVDNQKYFLSPI